MFGTLKDSGAEVKDQPCSERGAEQRKGPNRHACSCFSFSEARRSPEPGPSEAGDWELRLGFRLQHRRVLNPFEGRAEVTGGDSVRCFSYTEGARPFPAEDRGLLSGLVPCCWETGAAPQRLPMDLRSSHRSPVQSEWLKSKGEQGTKKARERERGWTRCCESANGVGPRSGVRRPWCSARRGEEMETDSCGASGRPPLLIPGGRSRLSEGITG
ncbi:uncharacterized protein [Mobula birostris]|uniref:uncharacterized protein n=1 Tax=Mobula birostris TaxID=1983395 RepID=UPI003B27F20B